MREEPRVARVREDVRQLEGLHDRGAVLDLDHGFTTKIFGKRAEELERCDDFGEVHILILVRWRADVHSSCRKIFGSQTLTWDPSVRSEARLEVPDLGVLFQGVSHDQTRPVFTSTRPGLLLEGDVDDT